MRERGCGRSGRAGVEEADAGACDVDGCFPCLVCAFGGQNVLAYGLLRRDVVAEIDGIELAVALRIQLQPTPRGSAFAVLLVVALPRLDEFRS